MKRLYVDITDICIPSDDNNYDELVEFADAIAEQETIGDVAPVRHEEDGTLWVTVRDCETVGRVIVRNEQGHFCRVFYMGDGDEEPVRHGKWELNTDMAMHCSCCGELFRFDDKDECLDFMEYAKYCIACGAKMDEGEDDED